jgi:hypothetical protein
MPDLSSLGKESLEELYSQYNSSKKIRENMPVIGLFQS